MNDPLSLNRQTTGKASDSPSDSHSEKTPKSQLRTWHAGVLAMFLIGTIIILQRHNAPAPFQKEEGAVFGTFYHLTYQYPTSLKPEIERVLAEVDSSLSMFNPNSIISRVNRNEDVTADSLFRRVFALSRQVSEATGGAFDITVAPLVNAWGFGFRHDALPDSATVDSLRSLVGWQHVRMDRDGHVHKDNPDMVLDCSAVAKGFGVDMAAELLRSRGISDFMVEIGGEIVVSGKSPKGEKWRVGVNRPDDDSLGVSNSLQTVLQLTGCAMATSGNYRNYYEADGKRLAHTIDPYTGYPVQHSPLSATVFANTCAEADAFATSFMVMGLEGAQKTLRRHKDIGAYLIYADGDGVLRVFSTIEQADGPHGSVSQRNL